MSAPIPWRVQRSPLEVGLDFAGLEVEDADHWVAVYSELVQFRRDLLREIDRQAGAMGEEAARQVTSNRRDFVLELQRLELQLEYWRDRRDELRRDSSRP